MCLPETHDAPRNARRAVPAERLPGQLTERVEVHFAERGARRLLTKVERERATTLRGAEDDEAAPPEVPSLRVDDRQGERGRHGGVHCVTAVAEDL